MHSSPVLTYQGQKRDTVASFLADVVNKFLTRHGFLDEPTIRPKKRPRTVSPMKGQRSDLAREASKESVVSVPLSRTSTEIDIVIDEVRAYALSQSVSVSDTYLLKLRVPKVVWTSYGQTPFLIERI